MLSLGGKRVCQKNGEAGRGTHQEREGQGEGAQKGRTRWLWERRKGQRGKKGSDRDGGSRCLVATGGRESLLQEEVRGGGRGYAKRKTYKPSSEEKAIPLRGVTVLGGCDGAGGIKTREEKETTRHLQEM